MSCSVCGREEDHCLRCHHVNRMLDYWPLWKRDDQELSPVNHPEKIPDQMVELAREDAKRDLGLVASDRPTVRPIERKWT